jgi:hypothetical protein
MKINDLQAPAIRQQRAPETDAEQAAPEENAS